MQVVFFDRTNEDDVKPMPYDFRVKQYSWNVFGGPEEMTCRVDFGGQNESVLWSMVSNLRCGVWVVDDIGRVVWWGYIHEIKITNGRRSYGISLDTMFNRAKATCELLIDGDSTGLRYDTTWQSDLPSIAEFGTHEKVYPLVTVSIDAAEEDVLTRIAKSKYPTAIADMQIMQDDGKSAELLCKGWWYTLDWLYYENNDTGYEEIGAQIVEMVEASEFIDNVYLQCTASTLSTPYREGDNLLRDEAEQLMNIGTDNNLRILAEVTKERIAYLKEEPEAFVDGNYYLNKNNQLFDTYGNRVDPTVCKVGVWAELMDFEGIAYSTSVMIPPSPVFIERAVYNAETGIYQPEQRGYKSPFDEIQDIQR